MWPLQQLIMVKKSLSRLITGSNPENLKRVMNDKENKEMMNTTICRNKTHVAKRIWGAQRRLFIIPCSEKQIMCLVGESYMDA